MQTTVPNRQGRTTFLRRLWIVGALGFLVFVVVRLWANPASNWPVMFCVLAGGLAGIGFGCAVIAFTPDDGGPHSNSVRHQSTWFAFILGVPTLLIITWTKGIGDRLGPYWDTISV